VPQLKLLIASYPLQWPKLDPRAVHVGFVVDIVVLGQVCSKYLVSTANTYSTKFSILMSSGAGTINLLVAGIVNKLNLTTPNEYTNKKL
jgi:hypothetical protein